MTCSLHCLPVLIFIEDYLLDKGLIYLILPLIPFEEERYIYFSVCDHSYLLFSKNGTCVERAYSNLKDAVVSLLLESTSANQ